jgi:perosamine synthetase
MKINLSSPDITQAEIDAVVAVLKTPNLSLGPKLGEFETAMADYVGRRFAVAVNSGTSALQLCLLALGIGPGDEVLTTPFSFISTTNVILMVGATPIFVDIDPVTYNIDVESLAEKITDKTKAIIPVEVFGNPARLDEVYDFARNHGLACIEDSCEALGSIVNGRRCGTLGQFSTFAFYPNKQMTTGEGGIILTDDADLAALCASLRNQGRDAHAGWLAHARLGYNYRLCDINCALGIVQLSRIEHFVAQRQRVFDLYKKHLQNDDRLILPYEPANCRISWFVYVPRLADRFTGDDRNRILEHLRENGIGASNYFTPIHLQPYIVHALGTRPGQYPVTEYVAQRTMALPFHNHLSEQEIRTVCQVLTQGLDALA